MQKRIVHFEGLVVFVARFICIHYMNLVGLYFGYSY